MEIIEYYCNYTTAEDLTRITAGLSIYTAEARGSTLECCACSEAANRLVHSACATRSSSVATGRGTVVSCTVIVGVMVQWVAGVGCTDKRSFFGSIRQTGAILG